MSFDWLAPHYRWMEALLAGGKLQHCRTAFLHEVKDARHALILGEGNGRFLAALLRANPFVRVVCLDGSAPMLKRAATRLRRAGLNLHQVEFIHANAMHWSPQIRYDLIVTHFFLDCFPPEQLRDLVERMSQAATADSRWLIADFCEPAKGPARWRAQAMLAIMYWFFRRTTRLPAQRLTPPDPYLERRGFRLQRRCHSEWGLLHTDLWRFNGAA
jgi:ubiquinone/menaquinone biosynthesis C-methylase UbiE